MIVQAAAADWIRAAPATAEIERIEAFFLGHAYEPHRHDTYALGLTLQGLQTFRYRGVRACSRPGNAILLHPDELHDGRAGAPGGFRYRMLYVEPRLIQAAGGHPAGALPFVREAISTDPRVIAILAAAFADLDRAPDGIETAGIAVGLADALAALDPSLPRRWSPPVCAAAVERARAMLHEQFDQPVPAEALEAASGLDRYTLARQFRRRLGTSPHRYLTMRRLDAVRQAIARGASLADAAAAGGFADQSHMTRHFKRAYGLSPGRWRRLRDGAPGSARATRGEAREG
ncbi:AraC family transcriptional regulator [Allostella vacuolata]|nr:AraC family transcriptional regulator [Stella vacuolata]